MNLKRILSIAISALLCLALLPTAVVAAAPAYNPYISNKFSVGSATPASLSGTTQAVPYELTEAVLAKDSSGKSYCFDDTAVQFKAEFTSPVAGGSYGSFTFNNNTVQYTPSSEAADKTVKFLITAANAKGEWSTGGVTISVAVGSLPSEGSSNADLSSLSYQVAGGESVSLPGFDPAVTEYRVALPTGTQLGQTVTLTALADDANASVSTTQASTAWESSQSKATATVTAENGSTQKVYSVLFYVQPADNDYGVYIDGQKYSDGDSVVFESGESRRITITLGSGAAAAGSASYQSHDGVNQSSQIGGSYVSGKFSGLYPYIEAAVTVSPSDSEEKYLTISFYTGDVTSDSTLTPISTVTLKIIQHDHSWGTDLSYDNLTHWNSCTDPNCPDPDARGNEAIHSGGEATCCEKAVCEHCKQEYGDFDSTNHTALTHVPAVDATHLAEGNIEYWKCTDCKKYFSDSAGTTEIEIEDTVLDKAPDHIPDGNGYSYDDNSHWLTCICGAKIDSTAHTLDFVIERYPTEAVSGSGHYECSVCGYVSASVPTYSAQPIPETVVTPSQPSDEDTSDVTLDEDNVPGSDVTIDEPVQSGQSDEETDGSKDSEQESAAPNPQTGLIAPMGIILAAAMAALVGKRG